MNLETLAEEAILWSSILSVGMLLVELLVSLVRGKLQKLELKETLSSLGALVGYGAGEVAVRALVLGSMLWLYHFIPWKIATNLWTILAAIVVSDFIYYWQHRLGHEMRLFWLAHSVHHSSPVFNSSVNFRLSVFDPLIAIPFLIPMVLLGFDPVVVLFSQVFLLAYQSWIHTELIGRLPVLDWWLNTPSNHRVHHGADDVYLDKNYGGVLMIWDHLFNTYQKEEFAPGYGLTVPLESQNPIKVWFSEFPSLFKDLKRSNSALQWLRTLTGPPGARG
jgi:sterol desaturase/sphingolipid hydroxylase (fatty acid hydroxylase superfamily)